MTIDYKREKMGTFKFWSFSKVGSCIMNRVYIHVGEQKYKDQYYLCCFRENEWNIVMSRGEMFPINAKFSVSNYR